jgi:hypothetical protein
MREARGAGGVALVPALSVPDGTRTSSSTLKHPLGTPRTAPSEPPRTSRTLRTLETSVPQAWRASAANSR